MSDQNVAVETNPSLEIIDAVLNFLDMKAKQNGDNERSAILKEKAIKMRLKAVSGNMNVSLRSEDGCEFLSLVIWSNS